MPECRSRHFWTSPIAGKATIIKDIVVVGGSVGRRISQYTLVVSHSVAQTLLLTRLFEAEPYTRSSKTACTSPDLEHIWWSVTKPHIHGLLFESMHKVVARVLPMMGTSVRHEACGLCSEQVKSIDEAIAGCSSMSKCARTRCRGSRASRPLHKSWKGYTVSVARRDVESRSTLLIRRVRLSPSFARLALPEPQLSHT
jgi:hypothetical protein